MKTGSSQLWGGRGVEGAGAGPPRGRGAYRKAVRFTAGNRSTKPAGIVFVYSMSPAEQKQCPMPS